MIGVYDELWWNTIPSKLLTIMIGKTFPFTKLSFTSRKHPHHSKNDYICKQNKLTTGHFTNDLKSLQNLGSLIRWFLEK